MPEETAHYLTAFAFGTASALAAATARACGRAARRERSTAESGLWAAVALAFVFLAWVELARPGPWLGLVARRFARDHGLWQHHREYQVVVTAGVALVTVILLLFGLLSAWNHVLRHRLAIACAAVVTAYSVIRFVSLAEVDAWSAARPWARVVIALAMAATASVAAAARHRRVRVGG